MVKPKVSIIISYYDGTEKYVDEAINSCLNQTYSNIQIILIDDGSTSDSARNKLSQLESCFGSKIKILYKKHQGEYGAKNDAISLSSGRYICCLDGDDVILPTYIEKLTKGFTSKNIAVSSCWFKRFGKESYLVKTPEFDLVKLLSKNCLPAAALFRKSVWKRVGHFSYDCAELSDWDFWIKCVALGYKWKVIKEPLFYYRVTAGSQTEVTLIPKWYQLVRLILNKHRQLYENNLSPVIIQIMKDDEATLNAFLETRGWKLLEKMRFIRSWLSSGLW